MRLQGTNWPVRERVAVFLSVLGAMHTQEAMVGMKKGEREEETIPAKTQPGDSALIQREVFPARPS